MEFSWTTEQVEIYDRVLAFSRKELNHEIRERDREHRFPRREWRKCGEFGLTGLSVPERYGGMGLDCLTTARIVEAFGRGCEDGGLVFSVAAHLFACVMPIYAGASDELRERLLPRLCDGTSIGANAITEAEAGSDVHALACRAVRDGDDYVLNGEKTYVTNGPVADLFVVYATTNRAFGYMGITAFVVPRQTEGLVVGEPFDKTGLTTSPVSSVYLQDCRVPAAYRLNEEGQGGLLFKESMHWERACLFAMYVGAMDRQLERAIEFATTRRQFGKTIGKFQGVSHRIADMKLRLESARLLLYRACWLRDQGHDATLDIALAKVAISEAAVRSGIDTIQVFGGSGVIREFDVERELRDALPSTLFSGTSEIQRNLIAARLGL
ncbi:MAG: acyl-CoA dehydrogenase family protein [Myxococcota bacterium]